MNKNYYISSLVLTLFLSVFTTAHTQENKGTPPELEDVDIIEHLGETIPGDIIIVTDLGDTVAISSLLHQGKPIVLNLAYYQCPMLCNLVLNGVSESMSKLDWDAGAEFQALVVSINPDETHELAAAKKINYIDAFKAASERFRVPDQPPGAKGSPASLAQLLRRPEVTLAQLAPALPGELMDGLSPDDLFTAETDIKYDGYAARQKAGARALARMEHAPIHPDFDYAAVTALRPEAREKLALVRPQTLGQAGRIAGVNPPDVALLSVHLKRRIVSRETMS